MKNITSGYKEQISTFGRELDSKITYTLNNENIELGVEDLNSISPHYEGGLLKSVMKQIDIDSNVYIPKGTIINYQFGVKVNNSFEYIDFGNYIVNEVEKQEDTDSWNIVAYDKMLYSMVDYEDVHIAFPVSVREYINAICLFLGIDFANEEDTFVNYDKVIDHELYLNANGDNIGYKFRDVLDELAQVTASTICINENDELEIRYINETNDTINEEFFKDVNVKFSELNGPINTVILTRGESDKIYKTIPENLPEEDRIAIEIKENQIMNFDDRDEYAEEILEQLYGLEYAINDYPSPGITYYELCDKYNVQIGNQTYPCIMLNDDIMVDQGLEESVNTPKMEKIEADYSKADKTDRKINQTIFQVNKHEQQIRGLISTTDSQGQRINEIVATADNLTVNIENISNSLEENYYSKSQTEQVIVNATEGLTNTFTDIGGSNILKNTNFSSNEILETGQVYEYWYGNVERITNNNSINGYSILLKNNSLYQEQVVANGDYTLSFEYIKLNPLAEIKVIINDNEYELTETSKALFQTGVKDENGEYIVSPIIVNDNKIKIEFISDIDNACEIYDIMLNIGLNRLVYTQNQNELTTDTVKIGKGIVITSSTSDVKFTANNDGIRTKDRYNNVLTEFTDKGTTTKEVIVENQSQIVGILRQRVGNQVWDSLI